MEIGERIGVGRTSDVHAFGTGAVIKIPHPHVPDEWAAFEARLAGAVHDAGLPAPAVDDVVRVHDRNAIVFAEVSGPSMWQHVLDHPHDAAAMARELAAIQRAVFSSGIPAGVPDFVDRLIRRIQLAEVLPEADLAQAATLAGEMPRGAALLHGDLHPGNVLMGTDGPVVIDWFDAAIGHPVADIVRSSILIRPGVEAGADHLPGATAEVLARMHDTYVAEFAHELGAASDDLRTWEAVVAVGRLVERADSDERLLSLWNARLEPGVPSRFGLSSAAAPARR